METDKTIEMEPTMNDPGMPKTRKRCRTNNTTTRRTRERPSWSSLLSMFAAAAIVASPPSSSSSTTSSWAVRGQPTTESAAMHDPNDNNSNEEQQTANVRGGRGERGGRAFVRQQQQPPPRDYKDRKINNPNNHNNENNLDPHDHFLIWCQDSLGIDTELVEIDHFDYPDYLKAMEDRIDIFCDDCNDEDEEDYEEDFNNFNDFESETPSNVGVENESSSNTIVAMQHSLDDESDRYLSVNEEYPPVSVRGLKASRDIFVGEVVLSIPHSALWTVHNAIDDSGDANLVHSMGPEARKLHQWESPGMDEIPLLAITLLYHMDQKNRNEHNHGEIPPGNRYAPYLEILELQTNKLQDSIPHLWDSRKLRRSATPEVRRVARGIRKDVMELYESIVMVLIDSYPQVFGKTTKSSSDETEEDLETATTAHDEWMFSLEKFHWAFALVNSRHWHLEIPDDPFAVLDKGEEPNEKSNDAKLDSELKLEEQDSLNSDSVQTPEDDHETFTDQEGPPAATPTDEWVVIQDEKLREEEEREMKRSEEEDQTNNNNHSSEDSNANTGETIHSSNSNLNDYEEEDSNYWPSGNSFLAPLADLLNFGPPCTRGIYNPVTMAFEIVATCDFRKGQEITFWYTDSCEDVFVANYGFTMPMMVPKCSEASNKPNHGTSLENNKFQWQQQQQEHQQRYLEDELFHAYQEMDRLDRRLDYLMNVLEDCHCGNQTELLAGAWKYDNDNGSENPEISTNVQEGGNGASVGNHSEKPLLPRSPSPPPKKHNNSNNGKHSKNGPDAQHAIRDGRSQKAHKSSNSNRQMGQEHPQQYHRHHNQHGMTRFRSRSHHERRFEF